MPLGLPSHRVSQSPRALRLIRHGLSAMLQRLGAKLHDPSAASCIWGPWGRRVRNDAVSGTADGASSLPRRSAQCRPQRAGIACWNIINGDLAAGKSTSRPVGRQMLIGGCVGHFSGLSYLCSIRTGVKQFIARSPVTCCRSCHVMARSRGVDSDDNRQIYPASTKYVLVVPAVQRI